MASPIDQPSRPAQNEPIAPSLQDQVSLETTVRNGVPQRPPSPSQSLKRATTTPLPPTPSFSATSPRSSREPSPIRPPLKPGTSSVPKIARSRKNSQDLSPHRLSNAPSPSLPAVPSAAAVQRALSVTGTSQLPATSNPEIRADVPRPQRTGRGSSGSGFSASGIPTRLKSPPPLLSITRPSVYSPRKADLPLTPSIFVERPTPGSDTSFEGEVSEPENMARGGMRTPVRGISTNSTLETVQESSLPATAMVENDGHHHDSKTLEGERPLTILENPTDDAHPKSAKPTTESGSESGGNKSMAAKGETKAARKPSSSLSQAKPPIVRPQKSFSQLNVTKSKIVGEGSVKNMTVETETVSSIPQVAVVGGAGERGMPGRTDAGSSIRLKPSTETIRPKKEKKRAVRKAPSLSSGTGGSFRRFHHHHLHSRVASPGERSPQSVHSPDSIYGSVPEHFPLSDIQLGASRGISQQAHVDSSFHAPVSYVKNSGSVLTSFRGRTASSKADIFEAKVAIAVDEANSSDSEETFVYESNPPEPLSGRPHRFHSRTPSATSMVSQMDHYGGRSRQDGNHSIVGKKSMKFANSQHHLVSLHGGGSENAHASGTTVRGSGGSGMYHHHIGRNGRVTGGHTSLFDNESPFHTTAKSLRTGGTHSSHSSPRFDAPRSPHVLRLPGRSTKSGIPVMYDLEGEGADDERTPLIGTIRSGRTRYSRRPLNRPDADSIERDGGLCWRLFGCVFLGGLVGFLVASVVVGLILSSKPLANVYVKDIQNVLASEQELMLDLHVHAINPNLVAIQVSELDVNVFAKSKHVGTDALWREVKSPFISRHPIRRWRARRPATSDEADASSKGEARYGAWYGVDEGNDPIEFPGSDPQTMLLGQILEFDSPLIFDSSPVRHQPIFSMGGVRLGNPGNKTEGGTERWETVLQHPFELIVRGVLRYSLPISSRIRSASIGASVRVDPSNRSTYITDHRPRY